VALFTFNAYQHGDLGFKKGDIITVTKITDKAEDWWYIIIIPSSGLGLQKLTIV